MISVKDLQKSFAGARGEVRALRGVSFEVGKGELFTLLGPSGCGKTTTLRCIAGLEQPLCGEIVDRRSGGFQRRQRHLYSAGAAQHRHGFSILRDLAAHDGVSECRLSIGQRGEPRLRSASASARILDRLSLGTLADRLAPNLSGGQQQRVALARALVAQPQVLLLDEPLSNLDAKLREQMRFELKSLQESFGITTVYVTHDQEEALALSDRIGLMHEGMLLEVGAPTDLYLRPAHRITADFLGTANFIAGQRRTAGQCRLG